MITKHSALLILWFLFATVTFLYIFEITDSWQKYTMDALLIIASIVFVIPFIIKDYSELKSQWFRPIIVFLLGYFIVFFQKYFDLSFGLIDETNSNFTKQGIINKSLCISTLGLISLLIGYYSINKMKTHRQRHVKSYYRLKPMRLFFLISGIIFFLFKIPEIISGSYSQADLEASAGGLGNFSMTLFKVAFFTYLTFCVYDCKVRKTGSYKQLFKTFGFTSFIVYAIYCFFILIAGSRSNIILTLSALAFAFIYVNGSKIRLSYLIGAVFLTSFVMTFIGMTRGLGAESTFEERRAMYEMAYNSDRVDTFLPFTRELSGSLSTFTVSVANVPEKEDYNYGVFHIRALLTVIPFASRFTDGVFNTHWRYKSSDFYITYLIQGEHYSYGNGTSINADLYLNYGVLGVIIGLFLLGALLRKLDCLSFSTNWSLYSIALILVAIGYALPYNRLGFLVPIQLISFTCLSCWLFAHNNRIIATS